MDELHTEIQEGQDTIEVTLRYDYWGDVWPKVDWDCKVMVSNKYGSARHDDD